MLKALIHSLHSLKNVLHHIFNRDDGFSQAPSLRTRFFWLAIALLLLLFSLNVDILTHIVLTHVVSPRVVSAQIDSDSTAPLYKPVRVRAQIVDGDDADVGEWPWQVYIKTDRFQCGGSLIDEEWVLTTAHCLLNEPGTGLLALDEVSIILGLHKLDQQTNTQEIQAAALVMHEAYSLATNENDIGLIKLAEPAQLNETVSLVSLVGPTEFDTWVAPGTLGWATGWGATIQGGYASAILQEVALPIITNQTCNESYDGAITGNMFCAGFPEGGKDACQGDSGGPLSVSDGVQWKQAGIISWGKGCARPGYYGVYTRIYQYKGWLDQYIAGLFEPISTPTSVPPTSVPPTPVPPTSVPPTSVPPTSVPPTSVPPTSVPPTSVPVETPMLTATMVFSPTATPDIAPTAMLTVEPTVALTITATALPLMTATPIITFTAVPTATIVIMPTTLPTNTVVPTTTVVPTGTVMPTTTVVPTDIVMPINTVVLTNTMMPTEPPIDISTPVNVPTPTATFVPPTATSISPTATATFVQPTPEPTQQLTPKSTPVLIAGEIQNAGFDLGANGDWLENSSTFGNLGALIYSGEMTDGLVPHSGNYLAWLGGANSETSTLLQSILLPYGEEVSLLFRYTISSKDTCGQDKALITVDNVVLLELDLCVQNAGNSWREQMVDLTNFSGKLITLGFRVETDNDKVSSFFVDSLNLTIMETPVATSTSLLTTTTPVETPAIVPFATQLQQGNFEPISSDQPASTYWTQSSQALDEASSIIISSIGADLPFEAHSGTHMALLGMMNSEEGSLSQRLRIPNAERIALHFSYQIISTDACGYDSVTVSIAPADLTDSRQAQPPAKTLATYDLCHDTKTEEWISATLDVSSWRDTVADITLTVQTDQLRLSGMYIDDVQLLTDDAAVYSVLPQAVDIRAISNTGNPVGEILRVDVPSGMKWQATAISDGWLSLISEGQTVSTIESTGRLELSIHAQTVGLAAGFYSGTIQLRAADPAFAPWLTADVPVSLIVLEQPPADFEAGALTLAIEAGMTSNVLSWSLPDNLYVDSYRILRRTGGDFAEVDQVTTLSFSDFSRPDNLLQSDSRYCYQIEAFSRSDQFIWARSNVACLDFGYLTLSVPDVIGMPGAEQIIPITIQNAADLRLQSGRLELVYDARALRFISVLPSEFASGYEWTSRTEDIGGNRQLLTLELNSGIDDSKMNAASAVINGTGPLALISIQVLGDDESRSAIMWPDSVWADNRPDINGSSIMVIQSDGTFEEARLALKNGMLTATEKTNFVLGDINGDTFVSELDAAELLEMSVANLDPGYDPLRAGDITGNARLDSADASMILAYANKKVWPFQKLDASLLRASDIGGENSSVSIGLSDVSIMAGDTVSSSVWVNGLVDFTSADIVVTYDPAIVEKIASVSLAADPLLDGYLLEAVDSGAGQLRLAIAGVQPLNGDWSLLTVAFQAKKSASAGMSTTLKLVQAELHDQLGRGYGNRLSGGEIERVDGTLSVVDFIDAPSTPDTPAVEKPNVLEPQPNEDSDRQPVVPENRSVFLPLINQ